MRKQNVQQGHLRGYRGILLDAQGTIFDYNGRASWLDRRVPLLLEGLCRRGYLVGVVSKETRKQTWHALHQLGAEDMFQYSTCSDDPGAWLPMGEKGEVFAEAFNLKPSQVLILGAEEVKQRFSTFIEEWLDVE